MQACLAITFFEYNGLLLYSSDSVQGRGKDDSLFVKFTCHVVVGKRIEPTNQPTNPKRNYPKLCATSKYLGINKERGLLLQRLIC